MTRSIIAYNLRRAEQEAIRAVAGEGAASDIHAELSRLYSNRALWALGIKSGHIRRIDQAAPSAA